MNWKIGQKLVCIKIGLWTDKNSGRVSSYGPSYNEVCTILGINDNGYLELNEYQDDPNHWATPKYNPKHFRPLLGDSAIDELTRIEPVKETSDCPIEQPETV